MTGLDRPYPDEVAGPFPEPPLSFTDKEDRRIEVLAYDRRYESEEEIIEGELGGGEEFESLVAMYGTFDPADRAQGIPPSDERRIREWLAVLRDGYNVLAWHDDRVAGHATLVPDGEGAYELAIFVNQAYQGAGIGTKLMEALLGHAKREGVERVWLTVERWNRAAVSLYEKMGFETSDAQSFEMEMSIRI